MLELCFQFSAGIGGRLGGGRDVRQPRDVYAVREHQRAGTILQSIEQLVVGGSIALGFGRLVAKLVMRRLQHAVGQPGCLLEFFLQLFLVLLVFLIDALAHLRILDIQLGQIFDMLLADLLNVIVVFLAHLLLEMLGPLLGDEQRLVQLGIRRFDFGLVALLDIGLGLGAFAGQRDQVAQRGR